MRIGNAGLKEKESIFLNIWLDSESLLHDLTYFYVSVHDPDKGRIDFCLQIQLLFSFIAISVWDG